MAQSAKFQQNNATEGWISHTFFLPLHRVGFPLFPTKDRIGSIYISDLRFVQICPARLPKSVRYNNTYFSQPNLIELRLMYYHLKDRK